MLWTVLGTLAVQAILLLVALVAVSTWVGRDKERPFSLSISFDRRGYTGWGRFSLNRDAYFWVRGVAAALHRPCIEDQYNEVVDHIQEAMTLGYGRGKRDGLEDGFDEAVHNFETFGHPNPPQRRAEFVYAAPRIPPLSEDAAGTQTEGSPRDPWDLLDVAGEMDDDIEDYLGYGGFE